MPAIFPRPTEARPHFDRGIRHQLAREMEPAAAAYALALEIDPGDAETHNNLGAVLCTLGKIATGMRHFERALELRPDYLDAHNNLGLVHVSRRELAPAIRHFEAALALDPESRDPLRNLIVALREAGRPAASEAFLSQALSRTPQDAELLGMLASARADQGRTAAALATAERCLELDPENFDAHIVLGNCAMEELAVEKAIGYYDRAEELKPTEPGGPWNRAYARLLTGDFELGWEDYESRWRLLRVSAGDVEQYNEGTHWDGSSLDGKSILLHCEQGFGDTLQFVRYAAVLKARWDTRIVVRCQRPLVELLRSCPGVDEVVCREEPAPATDVQAPLLGLPRLLGASIHDIPAEVPYLQARSTGIEQMIARDGTLRVGIIWAGNITHGRDAKRSLHLGAIEHWAAIPGVRLHSLQVGPQEGELAAALHREEIVDVGGAIVSRKVGFADTAAAIAELDLVVSVDTSVAHLAGALGKPVWMMLPYLPDWRWLLEREDSPWYPTMRLFRQPRRGDWASVIDRVTRELRALTAPETGREPEAAELASVQRDESGAPRFSIAVPVAVLARDDRFAEFEHELARGGAHAETRAFLEAKLRRGDVFVDVEPGLGIVSLAAATLPGREVSALAVLSDDEEARLLLSNVARNELTGTVTVLVAPPGNPPIDAMTKRPLSETHGWVFLRVGSADAAPGALAGAAELVGQGRVAAFVWPGRIDRPADRIVHDTLAGLGFTHFHLVETSDGPELMPFTPDAGAEVVISLGARYLAAELARQDPDAATPAAFEAPSAAAVPARGAAQEGPPATLPRIGIDWQLGAHSGWGVYGLNLALHCLRSGRAFPVLFSTPEAHGLTPEQSRDLESAVTGHRHVAASIGAHPGETFTFHHTLLRALGNQLRGTGGTEIRARRNVGVVFFEDTHFDAGAMHRGRAFDRIVAGSTWNAELLRARGFENVSACLQGVDTTLFRPGERLPAFGDRFVVFSGGKLEYRKGQDIVVAAFREFRRRHPDALLLTAWHNHWPESMAQVDQRGHVEGVPAVGVDGRLDVVGWLVRNGIPADAVIDVGPVPNARMAELVRGADVALFPNRCEGGTNLVAMECMASGVPVILSANTGHLDLVAGDRCYTLTRQEPVLPYRFCRGLDGWGESSVEELLEQMERAYQDREEARGRGLAAAEFMSHLSWPSQIDRLLDAVGDLLAVDAKRA